MLDQTHQKNINFFISLAQGVPFRNRGRDLSGWDCWGLILSAYRSCFSLALPDLKDVSALDSAQAGELFSAHAQAWQEVPRGQEQPGDVALFRRGRWPCHVGFVAAPGQVLHVDAELGETFIEPFNRGALKHRLVGIYRHVELAGSY